MPAFFEFSIICEMQFESAFTEKNSESGSSIFVSLPSFQSIVISGSVNFESSPVA